MEKYLYLTVDLSCFIVPFLFSFHKELRFYQNWKQLFWGLLGMTVLFIPWDIWFTHMGIWGFSDQFTMGIKWFGLPIEEWMFFICIPYACVFSYQSMQVIQPNVGSSPLLRKLGWAIGIGLILLALFHVKAAYTFAASLLCGILVLAHVIMRTSYFGKFLVMFLFILVPFILSNGILTGITFWQYDLINIHPDDVAEKIVWYNNNENLGIRVFSMPLDDIPYGMLMLLLTITIYEYFQKRKSAAHA